MLIPVIEHLNRPECKVLNSAQMRDARHTSHFRIPSQPLDFETTVLQSAAKEIDKHKRLENTAMAGRGRGRGRRPVSSASGGRGRGRGQEQERGQNLEIHMSTFS